MTARIRPTRRSTRRPTRTDRLERDLGAYRSQADLTELAAVLDRHADAETAPLRELVDWTAAA